MSMAGARRATRAVTWNLESSLCEAGVWGSGVAARWSSGAVEFNGNDDDNGRSLSCSTTPPLHRSVTRPFETTCPSRRSEAELDWKGASEEPVMGPPTVRACLGGGHDFALEFMAGSSVYVI